MTSPALIRQAQTGDKARLFIGLALPAALVMAVLVEAGKHGLGHDEAFARVLERGLAPPIIDGRAKPVKARALRGAQ